jgi:catechol 2,3-dioxygenase-like lactoylglutathione lyase family enzyme
MLDCSVNFFVEGNMIWYVMVGSTNIKRSTKFYTATLAPLGYVPVGDSKNYIGFGPKGAPEEAQFFVTKPFNKKAATAGNGTMITLRTKSRKAVDGFHAAALANGGTDEGKPAFRYPADGTNYFAYIRDPDANKISAHCSRAKK